MLRHRGRSVPHARHHLAGDSLLVGENTASVTYDVPVLAGILVVADATSPIAQWPPSSLMHYAENSPIKSHLNVGPFNIFKALALTDVDLRALRGANGGLGNFTHHSRRGVATPFSAGRWTQGEVRQILRNRIPLA